MRVINKPKTSEQNTTLDRPASSTEANGPGGHGSQIVSGCGHCVPWLPLLIRLLKGIHEFLLLQPVS
jgi:hypothetical protein